LPDGRAFFLGANGNTAFYTRANSFQPAQLLAAP